MEDSIAGFKEVFPWLADNVSEMAKLLEQELLKSGNRIGNYTDFALPVNYVDKSSRVYEHRDVDYFTCGSKGVDKDALQLIKELNMRDLAVYKAAVERFGCFYRRN